MIDEKKEKAELYCRDGFSTAGSSYSFCNGAQWDRELGECRPEVAQSKSCDFETKSKCGWIEENDNDFPWLQKNGWNSFEKLESGPRHDHTVSSTHKMKFSNNF